jgi:hypothetical protein
MSISGREETGRSPREENTRKRLKKGRGWVKKNSENKKKCEKTNETLARD